MKVKSATPELMKKRVTRDGRAPAIRVTISIVRGRGRACGGPSSIGAASAGEGGALAPRGARASRPSPGGGTGSGEEAGRAASGRGTSGAAGRAGGPFAPRREGDGCDDQHDGHEDAGDAVGQTLDRCARGLGIAHRRDDPRRAVRAVRHLEVEPGADRGDGVVHRTPVGDDEPVVTPRVAQHRREQPGVLGGVDAVDAVVRAHHGGGTGIGDHLFERR